MLLMDIGLVQDNDSNAVVAEAALDRLACGLGGKSVLPHIVQSLPAMLSNPDWKYRHAALMAVSAVGEGCHKVSAGRGRWSSSMASERFSFFFSFLAGNGADADANHGRHFELFARPPPARPLRRLQRHRPNGHRLCARLREKVPRQGPIGSFPRLLWHPT